MVGKSSGGFSNDWKKRAGFTLVEVLLAVVILGVSLSALLAAAPEEFFNRPQTERARKFLNTFTFDSINKSDKDTLEEN